jgi:hypothetical protein
MQGFFSLPVYFILLSNKMFRLDLNIETVVSEMAVSETQISLNIYNVVLPQRKVNSRITGDTKAICK